MLPRQPYFDKQFSRNFEFYCFESKNLTSHFTDLYIFIFLYYNFHCPLLPFLANFNGSLKALEKPEIQDGRSTMAAIL